MSRSNVGNDKPHIFFHNGFWRVSRWPKAPQVWLWHKAHWQINQWNDWRHRVSTQSKSVSEQSESSCA